MSDPYLGELRLMSFATPPKGWALCNGQTLQIAQNQALFSLLGTTYGGNGQTTFMLPDLRGRTPLHPDSTLPAGTPGGQEAVTLSAQQMPAHNHGLNASSEFADSNSPAGALPATKGAAASTAMPRLTTAPAWTPAPSPSMPAARATPTCNPSRRSAGPSPWWASSRAATDAR